MAIGTAFHPRSLEHCRTLKFKDWAGYFAVCRYDSNVEFEYSAMRTRAGLMDASPLYKTRVRGPAAERVLDHLVPRDVRRQKPGRVLYTPWCNAAGKVLDDGTIQRLGTEEFRVTSAYPASSWIEEIAHGIADIELEEESEQVAALSLQGPFAREVLLAAGAEAARDLRYFGIARTSIGGVEVDLSRTGYSGDLGYELWVAAEDALTLYDHVRSAGEPYGLTLNGLDALDVARLEAGLILIDVDYQPAGRTVVQRRLSSPFELGLGWTVSKNKVGNYCGRAALEEERRRGSPYALVGLELDWSHVERLFEAEGLAPQVGFGTHRDPIPVYSGPRQIGYATSHGWSPELKRYLALATVESRFSALGTRVTVEHTVEFRRRKVPARVTRRPFFDPPHKRA